MQGRCRFTAFVFAALAVALFATTEMGFQVAHWARSEALPPHHERELRVFVYGESVVLGAPEPSVGFVEQLRHELRIVYPDRYVNVVNYGGRLDSTDVVRTASETLGAQPDVVIVLTGGNEYLSRKVAGGLKRRIQGSMAIRTLANWLRSEMSERQEDVWPDILTSYTRADLGERLDLFRGNITTIIRLAQAHGTPLLMCTVPSNLRDWPPVYRRLARVGAGGPAAYEAAVDQIERLIETPWSEEASARLASAESTYRDDAMLVYLDGLLAYRRGQFESAHRRFVEAKDLDPFPWRPMSSFNNLIRESAHAPNVHLVDLERIFNEHAQGGSPGFDLMADNIHPNPFGSAMIAQELTRTLRRIIPGSIDTACCDGQRFLEEIGYSGSSVEVDYLIECGKYTMKTPFYAFAVSRDYLQQAIRIAPSNWTVWANLATVSLLDGHVQEGMEEFRRATSLKGKAIDPADRASTPYLQEALRNAQ